MVNRQPSMRLQLILAFTAVYLIWGSTYLGIRYAVATLPPFLMAGSRFLIAGVILFSLARSRGIALPTRANWVAGAIVGLFLLVGGNGVVVLAEENVPSALTALLISMTPIWMTLIDWLRPHGVRPTIPVVVGLTLGFAGVALLIGPNIFTGSSGVDPWHMLLVPLASLSWAFGSIYARTAKMPTNLLMGTAIEMLCGGAILLALGLVRSEQSHFDVQAVSGASWIAFVYLITFGSLVAFTAYVWLLQNTTLARASTYAYVNPVVAVFLGWALAHEQLTPLTLVAAAIIIGAVTIITTFRTQPAPAPVAADVIPATQVGVAE